MDSETLLWDLLGPILTHHDEGLAEVRVVYKKLILL